RGRVTHLSREFPTCVVLIRCSVRDDFFFLSEERRVDFTNREGVPGPALDPVVF
ncbi:hypothetical protein AVEN_177787-1, partial [Araneus ventricosus]